MSDPYLNIATLYGVDSTSEVAYLINKMESVQKNFHQKITWFMGHTIP